MSDIDAVAKAIWDADDMAAKSEFAWGETTRASYRRMAQAAIDSLQLTQQWSRRYETRGTHGPWYHGTYETRSEAEDRLTELNAVYPETEDRRSIVSRFISPWTAVTS